MPGLTLYSGNRLEVLADKFAESLTSSPLPVMTEEYIVLQSMGMMKWLTVEMSSRMGIWSNYNYVFPNRMAGDVLNAFFPGKGDERFFDKETMTWKCMNAVLRERNNPFFNELSAYIKDDVSGVKLYQMSLRIIDVFDQYMTFRPEMIIHWDKGGMKGQWQPELWRIITTGMAGEHPPALLHKLFDLLKASGESMPENLPGRISVFGVSYLTVYHLNILRAVSLFSDVNLFMLNPSSEYWGNILTEKEKRKIISTSPVIPGDPEDYLHIGEGNTLLASLGRTGRDFLHHIFSSDINTVELFCEPERKNLLSMIQNDIYNMSDPAELSAKHIFTEDEILNDRSVTVNSCHCPVREAEILHDYILDLLNEDSSLSPADILVMTPDIEKYSGPVSGIFGRGGGPVPRIPFRIVDRKLKNEGSCIDVFFRILSLRESRFTSAEVMAILDCDDVRGKFALSAEDTGMTARWVRDTSVFWGIDSAHKESLGLPGIHENTWSFGLDRMLMGGIMDYREETCLGVLPYAEIGGSDLIVLGRFISFFNSLRDIYNMLEKDYTPEGWCDVIFFILDSLFVNEGETSPAIDRVFKAALKLKDIQLKSDFKDTVGWAVIVEYLDGILSESVSGRDFVSGSLTICGMLPMRSIPCRVICLLGMNDSAFPRKSGSLSFDIISSAPRRGDRSVRDEDRYLFLETLVSARDKLYISYTGQSVSGNNPLNPSAVVGEFLDYIDDNYKVDSTEKNIRDFVCKKHRIHSYNPAYFMPGSGFFTYQSGMIDGARSFASHGKSSYRFMNDTLPPLTGDERSISISDLASFLFNPSKVLLNRRLKLILNVRNDEFIDEEPFSPGSLDMYMLNTGIMNALHKGEGHDRHFNLVKASGILPHGIPGFLTYESSFGNVKSFYDSFSSLLIHKQDRADIDLDINGFRLNGFADNIYDGRMIFFRYASAKGSDILHAWVTHLALCASGTFSGDTLLISRNGIRGWDFIPRSEILLTELLDLYEKGMTGPLPLFPKSSFRYAETFYDGKKGDPAARAMKAAMNSYNNSYFGGDSDDPCISKVFGDSYIPSGGFEKFTRKVYFPVYDNMKKVEGI